MKKIEDRLELWRKKHYQTLWKKMKTDLIPNVKGGKKQRKNKKKASQVELNATRIEMLAQVGNYSRAF